MCNFYDDIRQDIFIILRMGLVLFAVFFFGKIPISHGVDIAFLGLPMLFSALYVTSKIEKLKVAGRHLPSVVTKFLILLEIFSLVLSTWFLLGVAMEKFHSFESISLQISICSVSFYMFYLSNFLHFCMVKQRLEVSPVLLELIDDVLPYNSIAGLARTAAGLFNDAVRDEKRVLRKQMNKSKKK